MCKRLLTFVLQVSALQAAPPVSFLAPVVVIRGDRSGSNPNLAPGASGLAAGDFNGDRKDDLAFVWNEIAVSPLYLYLSNGDGTFQPRRTVASGISSLLAAADFNSDGKLDLAVSYPAGGVGILLGNGDGTFQPAKVSSQILSSYRFKYVSDYNRDGKPDLILSDVSTSNAVLFAGKGDGTFDGGMFVPIIISVLGDFNGDGIPDLIGYPTPIGSYALFVYFGNGDGTFKNRIALRPDIGAALAADFNGDGKLDLISSTSQNNLLRVSSLYDPGLVALGNGDGTFQAPQAFKGLGWPYSIGDFNRDGKPDLFSGFGILTGNGDGTLNLPTTVYTPAYGCFKPIICSGGMQQVVAGDWNGDGYPGVAYSFSAGNYGDTSEVVVLQNAKQGDGILQAAVPTTTATAVGTPDSIVSAYGVGLAPTTASASGPPYPTELGGIRLHIGDRLATLFYVSPTQINYVLPLRSPSATSSQIYNETISIEHIGEPFVPKGISAFAISNAPGLYTVDSTGLAAATAVRVSSTGLQTVVPVVDCSQGPCTAVPIDTSGDPVYLSLYGTGFSTLLGNPNVALLSCESQPLYGGPQGQIPGMEQINLRLFPSHDPGPPRKISLTCTELHPPGVDPYGGPFTSNTVFIVAY